MLKLFGALLISATLLLIARKAPRAGHYAARFFCVLTTRVISFNAWTLAPLLHLKLPR